MSQWKTEKMLVRQALICRHRQFIFQSFHSTSINQLASTSSYLQYSPSNLLFPFFLLISLFPFCPSLGFQFSPAFIFLFVQNGSWFYPLSLSPHLQAPLLFALLSWASHMVSQKEKRDVSKTLLNSREHRSFPLGY